MFDVEFYEDQNGEAPIRNFIIDLQAKGQTSKQDRIRVDKILAYILVLERYGTRAGEPYVKHIEDDIWELRPLRDRIFFFVFTNKKLILLHHFFKKTQKTPRREIEAAIRNKKDYLERSKAHGKQFS